MVAQVFLQVGETQQQLEQLDPLRGTVAAAALRQRLHGVIRVGQEPVELARVERLAPVAVLESPPQASESLIEVVVQAKLFVRQSRRNTSCTASSAALGSQ